MNKKDLVELMMTSDEFESFAQAERALNAVIHSIEEGLRGDGTVQLVGFGTFQVKERAARVGRHPRTGEEMKIPASKSVSFRAGKSLKDELAAKSGSKRKK